MKIPYGNGFQEIIFYDEPLILRMKEKKYSFHFDENSFKEYVKDINNLLIIVNDHSRITPTQAIIKLIKKEIDRIKNLKFIIATGTHSLNPKKDLKKIFGEFLDEYKKKIIIHNGFSSNFKYFGTTSYGTKVYYNKIIDSFDNILLIGGVEPHYFAGYSGGRKSIFPGITAYPSIENNHKLALKETSRILQLKDNPVNCDIMEAISFIKKNIYSIQVVNNEKGEIKFISQGDLEHSFMEAVKFAKNYFTVPTDKKADLLISVVEPPFDRNFYQAHKGLENTKSILKENGTMILVAQCKFGIGNDNFYKLLKKSTEINNIFEFIKVNYKLGYHKTDKILKFLQNHKLILVTDIDKDIFSGINITIVNKLQRAYELVYKKNQTTILVYNAAVTVPVWKKR